MSPTSIINSSVISQEINDPIRSILAKASGDTLSMTEATEEGFSFVSYFRDEFTEFGHLILGNGTHRDTAARYKGEIYQDVIFGTYVIARLTEQFGNKISEKQIMDAGRAANEDFYVMAQPAVAELLTSPLAFARWQDFRRSCHDIEMRIQNYNWLEDVAKALQAIFDRLFEWHAADHLNGLISVAAEEAFCVVFSGTISSELASAACGRVRPSGQCPLSPGQADLLRKHCQLDVDNEKLFLIL